MNHSVAIAATLLICASFASAQPVSLPASSPLNLGGSSPRGVVCTSVGRPALEITLKNERRQVLNSFPYFGAASPEQPVIKRATSGQYRRGFGNWSVTVQRHWYKPVTLRGIRVQEDECGPVRPTPVTLRLRPVKGAPQIREFNVHPHSAEGFAVVYWPYFQRYSTFLDAPGSLSR